jgi:hypothetical protein
VDGTLIHSIGKEANKLHKECFTAGFKEVFGLDTNIDVVEHHGSTDPLIVLKVLEHHGIPKEQVSCCLSPLACASAQMEVGTCKKQRPHGQDTQMHVHQLLLHCALSVLVAHLPVPGNALASTLPSVHTCAHSSRLLSACCCRFNCGPGT